MVQDLVDIVMQSQPNSIKGSTITLALLFHSLIRALGIKNRLVTSFHPIPLSLATTALTSNTFPIEVWTEIYLENDWIPVDALHGYINDVKSMNPSSYRPLQEQISYIVAHEDNSTMKDVTRRYSLQWGAKTSRLRLPLDPDGHDWWNTTLWLYSKNRGDPFDDAEELSLKNCQASERMPSSLQGFINHPL